MNTNDAYNLLIGQVVPEAREGFEGFTPTNAYRAIILNQSAGRKARTGTQRDAVLAAYLTAGKNGVSHGVLSKWFGMAAGDPRMNVLRRLGDVNGKPSTQRRGPALINTTTSGPAGDGRVIAVVLSDAGKAMFAKPARQRPSKATEAPAEAEAEVDTPDTVDAA